MAQFYCRLNRNYPWGILQKAPKKIIIVLYLWIFKHWLGFTASSISRIIQNRDHVLKSIEFSFSFYDILTINQMSFWLLLYYNDANNQQYTLNVKSHSPVSIERMKPKICKSFSKRINVSTRAANPQRFSSSFLPSIAGHRIFFSLHFSLIKCIIN